MGKIFSKVTLFVMLVSSVVLANGDLKIIDFKKAKGMYNAKSALFMDARGFKLYQKGTIMGAVHVPQKQLGKNKKIAQRLPADLKTKIVTFCNGFKCEESDLLAHKLIKLGYKKVYVYKGGVPEWKEKKQPLMALVKECKGETKGAYTPDEKRKVTVAGASIYWGGESQEDGMIDQFWLSDLINAGKVPAGIQLVDVRKPSQYAEGHLSGAVNVPWDSKANKIDASKLPKDKLVVFYCNTGMQSVDAKGSLSADDTKNVLYLDANIKCENGKCTAKANENL
jgi:rhodanese-related sulfurtransferase